LNGLVESWTCKDARCKELANAQTPQLPAFGSALAGSRADFSRARKPCAFLARTAPKSRDS
jgi:hypothetical protein